MTKKEAQTIWFKDLVNEKPCGYLLHNGYFLTFCPRLKKFIKLAIAFFVLQRLKKYFVIS